MSNTKTVMGQASNQYVVPLDIDEVFSTYLYDGNGSTQTITNGIDLAGEGGMVWAFNRSISTGGHIYDTERGKNEYLTTFNTNAEASASDSTDITSFNSDGFSLGGNYTGAYNRNGDDHVSWTFRKAPKFFDVVTYTGTGSAQTISHNLGCVPGMVIVKSQVSAGADWNVYTSATGNDHFLKLNETDAKSTTSATFSQWDFTTPTSSAFYVGASGQTNANGETYVAYLFAHNDGDGGFGPDGDQDIIKCGSVTGDTSGDFTVDLGWEPQWVLTKWADATGNWTLHDTMRGFGVTNRQELFANTSGSEVTQNNTNLTITSTGFVGDDYQQLSKTLLYIAIRRGPLAAPKSATEVFDVDSYSSNGNSNIFNTGFDADMNIISLTTGSIKFLQSRLNSGKYLRTNDTNAESNSVASVWNTASNVVNLDDGFYFSNSATISWSWKRAPNYFDVVAYTGNSTAGRTVSHNLGVVPEMIWVKSRVYTFGFMARVNNDFYGYMNSTGASFINHYADMWNSTDPTSTEITLGTYSAVNASGNPYIAYLFASLPGISKVGSYTGSNSVAVEVDCGFTSGARFVLIKRTDATGDWYIYDSVRGIVSNADDPYLLLNTTDAEAANTNNIEPLSSGFKLTVQGSNPISINGGNYIFYAIA